MITCTITFEGCIVATAAAADQADARSTAWAQISGLPVDNLGERCRFHFTEETRTETAGEIVARYGIEFDPSDETLHDCVLELLYELGGFEKETDAGIEYYPCVFIVSSRHHDAREHHDIK